MTVYYGRSIPNDLSYVQCSKCKKLLWPASLAKAMQRDIDRTINAAKAARSNPKALCHELPK